MAKILQKLTVSISSLPDECTQKSMLIGYVANPSSQVNLVLTLEGGQFIGYIGYPDPRDLRPEYAKSSDVLYHCTKIRSHDQVSRLGDRLNQFTRDYLFPDRRAR
jgi:hypothetical protein